MVADVQGVEAARLDFPSKVEKRALISQHPRLDTELDWPCHDPTVPIGSAARPHRLPALARSCESTEPHRTRATRVPERASPNDAPGYLLTPAPGGVRDRRRTRALRGL